MKAFENFRKRTAVEQVAITAGATLGTLGVLAGTFNAYAHSNPSAGAGALASLGLIGLCALGLKDKDSGKNNDQPPTPPL